MSDHEHLLDLVATIDPTGDGDELPVDTPPDLDHIIGRSLALPRPLARPRPGWVVAAGVATLALLLGLIGGLLTRSDSHDPASDETTPSVASTTTTATVVTTTIPTPADDGTGADTTATTAPPVEQPAELVLLDMPMETDADLAYAMVRSLADSVTLERLRRDDGDGASGDAYDSLRTYSISVRLYADPEAAAAALSADLEDARDPSAPLPDGGEPPAPVEFDVPELSPARAVTYVFQMCGRGCREPEQTTELVFAVDRATLSLSVGSLSREFEQPGVQQAALTTLALELEALVRAGLDGSLADVRVARAPSLDSFYFSFGQAISESPEVMAGRTDETYWFAEAFSVEGVVAGSDLRCEVRGHFDPAFPLATTADIDSTFVVHRVDGDHTITRYDEATARAFWASTTVEEWWASIEHPEGLGIDDNPTDGLAELGMVFDESGVPQVTIGLEPWREYGYIGYPPGWIREPTPVDNPLVAESIDLCGLHSPLLSDAIEAAIAGQVGVHYMENGRDVVWYWLDREAAVRAGFFDADDQIETGDFAVVVDAIEPWVHSFRMDVGGPDEAMADHFRMIPPYTGLQTGMTIRWSFGAFNAIGDVETAEHQYPVVSADLVP